MEKKADLGLIGLAVMGQNLVLNMNDKGYKIAVFNRTLKRVDEFLANEGKDKNIVGAYNIEEFVNYLERPRKIMLMVKAGSPVDATIDSLIPFLEKGDIIIDGGNSHFLDTTRRMKKLNEKNILFVGAGVSGGEEGARFGPSIMPGGSKEAWPHIKPILQDIAAKVSDGTACCEWLGSEGSGHYVKMVHNGIEYGDMQLISEAYDLMKNGLGMSNLEMSETFLSWNTGELDSYLIEITSEILAYQDETGEFVLDTILDSAGQKGTGKWTANAALDVGSPLTLIGEAVFSRFLSAHKEERIIAAKTLGSDIKQIDKNKSEFLNAIKEALYASKIISYTQGYMLFKAAVEDFGWDLDFGTIALLWREGCIIRASFLDKIKEAYDQNPELENLLFAPYFKEQIQNAESSWRKVVAKAVELGIPVPAMSSSLAFFDGYRRDRLPANLLQAQRDYFGAHTYERIDRPRGEHFHTNWTGKGGDITSTTYDA